MSVTTTEMIKMYRKADKEIAKRIMAALASGKAKEVSYQQYLRRQIRAELNLLYEASSEWAHVHLPQTYIRGLRRADIEFAKQINDFPRIAHYGKAGTLAGEVSAKLKGVKDPVKLAAGFGRGHLQAVRALAEATGNRFADVKGLIGRRVDDIFREAGLSSVQGSVIGYDTWSETSERLEKDLRQHGMTGFVDKAGRRWNMETYADMVARTTTQEAQISGITNRLGELGEDLVLVSYHPDSCEHCVPYQGKLLSLTGAYKGKTVDGKLVKYTLQEAKDGIAKGGGPGLFHPNCRHGINLYVPEEELED